MAFVGLLDGIRRLAFSLGNNAFGLGRIFRAVFDQPSDIAPGIFLWTMVRPLCYFACQQLMQPRQQFVQDLRIGVYSSG